MRRALLLAAMFLAGCGDWPDLGVGGEVEGVPRLVPFDAVVAQGDRVGAAAEDSAEADAALLERAEALRSRAAATGLSAEDREALDALGDRTLDAR